MYVIFNQTSQDLFDSLPECMTEALKAYDRSNGILPDKIIIYRDGVSDGDLSIVIEHEVKQLISTCQLVQIGYECHLYFNWPETIRVPAVCQYAHKLAYLADDALHPSLAEKLFYL